MACKMNFREKFNIIYKISASSNQANAAKACGITMRSMCKILPWCLSEPTILPTSYRNYYLIWKKEPLILDNTMETLVVWADVSQKPQSVRFYGTPFVFNKTHSDGWRAYCKMFCGCNKCVCIKRCFAPLWVGR